MSNVASALATIDNLLERGRDFDPLCNSVAANLDGDRRIEVASAEGIRRDGLHHIEIGSDSLRQSSLADVTSLSDDQPTFIDLATGLKYVEAQE